MHAQKAANLDTKKLRLFAAFAAAAVCAEWAVTRTPMFHRGGAVPLAVLFDLVVALPLVYAAVVLRPAKRPLLDAAPVLALGALLAGSLLATRPEARASLRAAGAISELLVLAVLVRRVRKAAAELQGAPNDDLLLRIGTLTDPVLRVAGAEFLVLYYALVGPWLRRSRRESEFTYTENSGLGGLLLALGLVITMEGVVAHLLVLTWSPRTAWVLAASNVYALLWLAAAFQAARLRPVALSSDRLVVRTSMMWTVDVPRDAIGSVEAIDEMARGRGVLRAALGTAPVLLLTLTRPVVARGPLGIHRSVDRIALYVDEPARLRAALER